MHTNSIDCAQFGLQMPKKRAIDKINERSICGYRLERNDVVETCLAYPMIITFEKRKKGFISKYGAQRPEGEKIWHH